MQISAAMAIFLYMQIAVGTIVEESCAGPWTLSEQMLLIDLPRSLRPWVARVSVARGHRHTGSSFPKRQHHCAAPGAARSSGLFAHMPT